MASGRLVVNSNGTYVRFGRDRARSMNWRDTDEFGARIKLEIEK
jgi:hypothetical protein